MAWTPLRFGFLVLLLSLVSKSTSASSDDFYHCENTVKNWARSSAAIRTEEEKLVLKDLLFFLHVPRTGGRTFFSCFLRKMYSKAQVCPVSYDKLSIGPRKPNCSLMVNHDDYSLMSKLPKEKTSVVTILRNPIDRVFSAYEFSVEVAARFLVHPNLTSARQIPGRLLPKSPGPSTLEIWPWKYLVPWMREDLFTRREVRRLANSTSTRDISNPYAMEDILMPLHKFIDDPVVHDIIHNGATFQLAGLTNNSYLDESHKVRHCVRMHPSLGQHVLEIAKSRLDHMLYVGLTENHKESVTMFANMVGAQVLTQSEALSTHAEQKKSNTKKLSITKEEDDASNQDQHVTNNLADRVPSPTDAGTTNQNMTVGSLIEAYEACIPKLLKSQSFKRNVSLKEVAPAKFSKEARILVAEEVLHEILSLNSLDVELYKHAQEIFLQQKKHLMQQSQESLNQQHNHLLVDMAIQGRCVNSDECSPWELYSLAILASTFVVVLFLIVIARRRMSKVRL